MPRDPFAKVRAGETLAGLPGAAWNRFLDATDPEGLGVNAGAGRADGAVEFRVVNTTGSAVPRFGVLQINAPLNTVAVDLATFKSDTVLKGTAPAADAPFVVFQEGVGAGEVGRARVLGVTKCRVSVTDSAHQFAGPGTSTEHLESAASGPARIVWVDPDCAGSGSGAVSGSGSVCWAWVLLGGAGAGTRVEPGEPRNDGVTPPGSEFASWSRLEVDVDTPAVVPVEAVWFIDLNNLP